MANYRRYLSSETGRSITVLAFWLWYLQLPLLVWSQVMCKDNNRVPVILFLLYGIFIVVFITIRYLNRS